MTGPVKQHKPRVSLLSPAGPRRRMRRHAPLGAAREPLAPSTRRARLKATDRQTADRRVGLTVALR